MAIKKTVFKNSGGLDMALSEEVKILQDEEYELDLHVSDMLHTLTHLPQVWEVEVFAVDAIEVKYNDGTMIRYERMPEEKN